LRGGGRGTYDLLLLVCVLCALSGTVLKARTPPWEALGGGEWDHPWDTGAGAAGGGGHLATKESFGRPCSYDHLVASVRIGWKAALNYDVFNITALSLKTV
jgi:hypothetical protein